MTLGYTLQVNQQEGFLQQWMDLMQEAGMIFVKWVH